MANNPKTVPIANKVDTTQLQTLASGGSITKGEDTYTADERALYLTEETIDTTPTANSDNLVTSGGVYNALGEKADISDLPPTVTITTTSGSESVSDGTNTLNFGANAFNSTTIPTTTDSVTQSSTAALTSGGAYTALDSKMDKTNPTGTGSLSINRHTNTIGDFSAVVGNECDATGEGAFAEGYFSVASGEYSHAEGYSGSASGNYSHSEGKNTNSQGIASHTEGNNTTAYSNANYSHVEGNGSSCSGVSSHAEGESTSATKIGAHSEGGSTQAKGEYSHAEGYSSIAQGNYSHAEGNDSRAYGELAHAEGNHTWANRKSQHTFGEYNIIDYSGTTSTRGTYAEVVGNGTSESNRSNARTLDWSGNEEIAGNLKAAGLTDGTTTKTMSNILSLENTPLATTAIAGKVKPDGTSITIDNDGTIHSQYNGTVTSITAGTGLSGGTITTSGTIALSSETQTSLGKADTAVQPSDLGDLASQNNIDYTSNQITNKPTIPTTTNELTNNSGFITNAVNNLTNYYLKTDTYTQTEVNSLIANIKTITAEIVASLPTASSTTYFNTSKKIYLVLANNDIDDFYNEYITILEDSEYIWEKIGDTKIDLSNYQTKITSTNKLNSDLVSDANQTNKFVTETEKNTWNGKQNVLSETQLNAVNSGITSTLVGKITTNETNITTLQTSKQNTITSSNKLSADLIEDGTTNKVFTATEKTKLSELANTPIATTSVAGKVKPDGTSITVDTDGTIHAQSSGVAWGTITGTLSNQTDLQNALDGKQNNITSSNKLSADLIADGTTNKVVTSTEKSTWNGKQNALDTTQMNAVNSGVTSTTVTQVGTNTTNIAQCVRFEEESIGSADPSPLVDYYNKSSVDSLLNQKANTNLSNVTATRTSTSATVAGKAGTKYNGIHLCVESWKASDNSQWYRIYDDGWKECGGTLAKVSDAVKTVSYGITFSIKPSVVVNLQCENVQTGTATFQYISAFNVSSSNFQYKSYVYGDTNWYACGY